MKEDINNEELYSSLLPVPLTWTHRRVSDEREMYQAEKQNFIQVDLLLRSSRGKTTF